MHRIRLIGSSYSLKIRIFSIIASKLCVFLRSCTSIIKITFSQCFSINTGIVIYVDSFTI